MIWKISLRNLAAHKVRLVLTLLAVVLGTAFVAGSFVFTDTLKRTFDGIFENLAKGVDVRVSGEGPSGAITLGQVPRIRDVPGVAKVAPSVRGSIVLLDKDNKPIQNGGALSEGMTYLPRDQAIADELRFVEGRPPQSGEVALNTGAAELADLHPGDTVRLVVNSLPDPVSVKLSGIYEVPTDTGGYVGAVFEDQQAKRLFTDGNHVAYVDVAGKDVSPEELRDRIQAAFPGLKVQTGDEVRNELKSDVFNALRFINYFLFAFGVISLTVATFIIYNTFSMIVAQRLGELALLRATGASRAQIRNSVALEALVIGVLGSIIGLFGGIGLAYGLRSALNAAGFALPAGRLQLTAQAVVLSLVVGVVVTVISAYAPARRAAKISPIEAMRMEFSSGEVNTGSRTGPAVAIAVVGVVVVLCGVFATTSTSHAIALVAIGAAWLILAGTLAAETVLNLLISGLGYAVRPFGAMGDMGRRNAIRNPRRTIATASALTLGLMLVSVVGILGASAKASVNSLVDNGVNADFVLSSAGGGPVQRGIPTAVSKAAAAVGGVRSVTPLHQITTSMSGARVVGTSTEGDLRAAVALKIVSGSARVPADGVLLSEERANGRRPGDVVEFSNPSGAPIKATIAGIYERNPIVGDFVAGPDLYQQLVLNNQRSDAVAFVSIAPDAVPSAVRAGLEDATAQFYTVQVLDPEQFKGSQARQIDTLLGVLYGLLGLAVIIGILGIINTLALSVVERRREIGMLRAVGMLRVQIRRIIYVESVLIALAGAIVGIVLGIPLGVAFVRTLASQGLQTTAIPWVQVIMMLVASAVVGVLAALWPATRAARTSPLEAIVDV